MISHCRVRRKAITHDVQEQSLQSAKLVSRGDLQGAQTSFYVFSTSVEQDDPRFPKAIRTVFFGKTQQREIVDSAELSLKPRFAHTCCKLTGLCHNGTLMQDAYELVDICDIRVHQERSMGISELCAQRRPIRYRREWVNEPL